MANWVDAADGASPAQFVVPEIPPCGLPAGMSRNERSDAHFKAQVTHCFPHRVVIGQPIGETLEAPDDIQGASPKRDGRAKAWMGQSEAYPGDGSGQELRVDPHGRELAPDPAIMKTMIEAS